MALNGPEALRSLDDAIHDIRREESEIGKRLARGAERAAKLRETEAELFLQLANLRLDISVGADTTAQLSRVEKHARAMLVQHAKELSTIEENLDALERSLADKSKQRQTFSSQTDDHQNELRALSSQIELAIKKDPTYEEKRLLVQDLREIANESVRKTEQAETDQQQKGRPYRDDPLFMYLWEAGFGTKSYKASNLVQWLDSRVARMVGYDKARPNFAMLNEIPLRLREHAERQLAAAQEAENDLDLLEINAIDAAGGKPIRDKLARAQDAISKLDAEMVALEDERDEVTETFRHLAEGRDPQFEKAIQMLASSLQTEDVKHLWSEARRTATPKDDAVLVKIEDARAHVVQEKEDTQEHRARLKVLATRRRELEDIEFEFKKAHFDDPRSSFREGALAGDLLNEFLQGALSASNYWRQWQRSQHWRPGTTDWGGGFGLPRSGRSNKSSSGRSPWSNTGSSSSNRSPWGKLGASGGFSRPRPGSKSSSPLKRGSGRSGRSGSRKHGGFKTGGGF